MHPQPTDSWLDATPTFLQSSRAWVRRTCLAALLAGAAVVLGVLVWQGVTAHGNPTTTAPNLSPTAVAVNAGIIVFREGLEAILVLAALTAGLLRTGRGYWKPIGLGAGLSFLATLVTWFVVVGIIADVNAPELDIQAATGLLAVVVLLVIMNWFFHRLYWSGWIAHHDRRKRSILENAAPAPGSTSGSPAQTAVFRGLLLVGFTAVYREGFEVVLFLQNLRLQAGGHVVLAGASLGLALTLIVGVLTFVAHYRLPYRKMLIFTGILIGAVLIVMVGESIQEMQQAGWLATTTLPWPMPDWLNLWFAVYPSVQSLVCQVLAGVYVIGVYYLARWLRRRHRR